MIERTGNRFGKASKKQAGNDDPEEGVRRRTSAAGERKAVSSCRPHREQVTDVFRSVESPWPKGCGGERRKKRWWFPVPRSGRACRLVGKLNRGSLGTIFFVPTLPQSGQRKLARMHRLFPHG